jgi:lysine/ornithine N-monooxygenase
MMTLIRLRVSLSELSDCMPKRTFYRKMCNDVAYHLNNSKRKTEIKRIYKKIRQKSTTLLRRRRSSKLKKKRRKKIVVSLLCSSMKRENMYRKKKEGQFDL